MEIYLLRLKLYFLLKYLGCLNFNLILNTRETDLNNGTKVVCGIDLKTSFRWAYLCRTRCSLNVMFCKDFIANLIFICYKLYLLTFYHIIKNKLNNCACFDSYI